MNSGAPFLPGFVHSESASPSLEGSIAWQLQVLGPPVKDVRPVPTVLDVEPRLFQDLF